MKLAIGKLVLFSVVLLGISTSLVFGLHIVKNGTRVSSVSDDACAQRSEQTLPSGAARAGEKNDENAADCEIRRDHSEVFVLLGLGAALSGTALFARRYLIRRD